MAYTINSGLHINDGFGDHYHEVDLTALEARVTTAEGKITTLISDLNAAEATIALLQLALKPAALTKDERTTVAAAGLADIKSNIKAVDERTTAVVKKYLLPTKEGG